MAKKEARSRFILQRIYGNCFKICRERNHNMFRSLGGKESLNFRGHKINRRGSIRNICIQVSPKILGSTVEELQTVPFAVSSSNCVGERLDENRWAFVRSRSGRASVSEIEFQINFV